MQDTDAFHCKEVVRGIRMVVHATKERCRCIFANVLAYKICPTRVLVDERRDVMDETAYEDQRAKYRLVLENLPTDDGQVIAVRRPGKLLLCLPETFELHCQLAFTDFIVWEDLQMTSQSKLLAAPNEPFRRIILVPLDSVPVIHRELVVEIVVPFANGDEGGDEMVSGGVLVIKRSLAQPMRKGVNAECAMMNKTQSDQPGIDQTAAGISPADPCDQAREPKGHCKDERNVEAMLPADDGVFGKIGYVGRTGTTTGSYEHPSDVGIEETAMSIVRV